MAMAMAADDGACSFTNVRKFVERMKALGFPDQLSSQSFRTPNFDKVAACIRWILSRYEPCLQLDCDLSTEDKRVSFLKSASQLMFSKTRLRWDIRNLYAADDFAVNELLKASSLLQQSTAMALDEGHSMDAETTLFTQAFDVKAARVLVMEIVKAGTTLDKDLASEMELQAARCTAASTSTDIEQIENMMHRATNDLLQNVSSVEQQCHTSEKDEKSLSATYEKRKVELERCKKRLSVLQNVRPAYLDEYEVLQTELQRLFGLYLEKFHNLQWLESQLEAYKQEEREKFQESYALQHLEDDSPGVRGDEAMALYDGSYDNLWTDLKPPSDGNECKMKQGASSLDSSSGAEAEEAPRVQNEENSTDDDF